MIETLGNILGIIVLCACLLIPIYIFYRLFKHVFDEASSAWSSTAKNSRDARVIGKRQQYVNQSAVSLVAFEFNDGSRKELIVLNGDYGILQKGDTGKVRYNGKYYKGFERYTSSASTKQNNTVNRSPVFQTQSNHKTQHSREKLQLGLERLHKAGNDPDFLGMALISLHGALEDYFRDWLSSHPSVPPSIREEVMDSKKTQWKSLLDLMQQYGNLDSDRRNYIFRMNRLRQEVGHGGQYAGTRSELEKYADFVKDFIANGTSTTANQN